MRHRVAGLTLSRTSAHRQALFSNLVAALLTHESIRTTDAKAKETRRLAERTITWARRVGDVLAKKPDRRSTEEAAQVVHAIRMARRVVRDRGAVVKLFDELAPRFASRRGGYTRIVKLGQRPGDAAPMSLLELIPDDSIPAAKSTDAPETKGRGAAAKVPKAEAAAATKAPKAKGDKKAAASEENTTAKKPKSK
ncbi:MAG TPA: 50S ribosomal protein L17 [Polyangia bacterium]|jgi:large subunit ribosomal protein L17|nr:50S ribosomal protein L17 [Polyangia bacterium]